jgi:hypothetical protein
MVTIVSCSRREQLGGRDGHGRLGFMGEFCHGRHVDDGEVQTTVLGSQQLGQGKARPTAAGRPATLRRAAVRRRGRSHGVKGTMDSAGQFVARDAAGVLRGLDWNVVVGSKRSDAGRRPSSRVIGFKPASNR